MVSGNGFGRAIRWNTLGSLSRAIAALFVQVCLMRLLGPEILGQFAIYLLIVGFGTILSDGGIGSALVRSPQFSHQLLRVGLFWTFVYSSCVALSIVALQESIARVLGIREADRSLIVYAALTIVPLALSSVPMSVLRREYRALEAQVIQLSAYIISFLFVSLPVAIYFPSVWALIAAFILQTLLALCATWIVGHCPLVPTWRGGRDLLTYGAKGVVVNMAQFINESIDNAFISHYLGPRSLGLYSMSFNLGRAPTDAIVSVIQSPLLVSSAHEQDDSAVAARRYIEILNASICLVMPIYLFVALFPEVIIKTLLGKNWIEAAPILGIIGIVMALRLLGSISGAVLWGRNRLGFDLTAQMMGIATFCIGFWIFPIEDVYHAAYVTLAAYGIRSIILIGSAVKFAWVDGINFLRDILAPMASTVLMMIPAIIVDYLLISLSSPFRFFVLAFVFTITYAFKVRLEVGQTHFEWQRRVAAFVSRVTTP
ncbi:oligosaccharide flippase family protein [Chthonobacter albigriseus]|uniref:oligosaccharide flippase family protein n=1 Tax=Chthonobacter albigriseus TaxID=1683161 RepID=UPI0015EF822E|nr:oligosaccharide flippase family protein [Chthonobacter albigriseus]